MNFTNITNCNRIVILSRRLVFGDIYYFNFRSVSQEKVVRIMQHIDKHKIVRGTYDIKDVVMGGDNTV